MPDIRHITCEDFFRRLDDFLDRELAPEEMQLVRDHLEICVRCAQEARFEASILDSLRDRLRRIQLPSDLVLRVRAELDRAQENTGR